MAHIAADGSKWTNASAAKRVPGRAQGDGKQPVSKFSKPEPARQPTAEPVSASPRPGKSDDNFDSSVQGHAIEVTHDGDVFTVTARYATEDEAQAAAQSLSADGSQSSGADAQGSNGDPSQMNPSQAMM